MDEKVIRAASQLRILIQSRDSLKLSGRPRPSLFAQKSMVYNKEMHMHRFLSRPVVFGFPDLESKTSSLPILMDSTVATEFMDCFGFRRVSIAGSKIHVRYNILLNFLYA